MKKKVGNDFAVGLIPNYNIQEEMVEQKSGKNLMCADNNTYCSIPPQHPDPDYGGQRKLGALSHKCHRKVLRWKVTGQKMRAQQHFGLFRHSSFVIGILLGLMCCGSLHAKGKTTSQHKH